MFGEAGPSIRAKIPDLILEEHERSAAAQEAWGHDAQLVYGNIWHGLLKSFEEFGSLPGATTMRPGQAPYRVPVINRTTLYVWRYGRSSEAELAATHFASSPARASLPSLRQRTVQETISEDFDPDLGLDEEDRRVLEVLAAVQAQPLTTNRLVVVAVASSIHALHRAVWGEMSIDEEGYPHLTGFTEDLLAVGKTGPVSLDSEATFTDGDLPDRRPEIVADDDEAASDDE
jgi:hypothetical protein